MVGVVESLPEESNGLGIISVIACAVFDQYPDLLLQHVYFGSIMEPHGRCGYEKGYSLTSCSLSSWTPHPSEVRHRSCMHGLATHPFYVFFHNRPGIILVIFCIVNSILVKKMIVFGKTPLKRHKQTMRNLKFISSLLMPIIILGNLRRHNDPTEAAAVSVLYAIPVGMLVYRRANLGNLRNHRNNINHDRCCYGNVFMVMILSRLLVMEDVPQKIADTLLSKPTINI